MRRKRLRTIGLRQGFLTWGAEINFRGCWGRSHVHMIKMYCNCLYFILIVTRC